ncbi:MAG: hypothetical protein JWQ43_1399 [Glaciihabitans sp.]|nr:hypothetical protein [Glaciihabitans sp.]
MRTPRRVIAMGAGVVLGFSLLTSCAQSTDISDAAADRLQAGVVDVANLASGDDIAGAITALEALQQALAETTASGDVSAERSARIQELITVVRADLDGAVATTPATPTEPEESVAPEPTQTTEPSVEPTTPEETTEPDENENEPDENEPDEDESPEAPTTPAPPASEEPAPEPATPATNTGNNGNGNGPDGNRPPGKDKNGKE